jgi:F-type H+-transporting ATPase subunit b
MILAEDTIQLVPDATLLLHLVLVVVMVYVLNRTLLKPINDILIKREKEVTGRLKEAEAMAAESQEKLQKYTNALREARSAGYKLLEKERADDLKEKEQKLRQSRDELSKQVAAQIDQIRKQEQAVKGELESQAATIGSLISSQILRRPAR